MEKQTLATAANDARGLAIDAVHACNSGHLGLPLGCAEVGAVLFGHALALNPEKPRWINRDRFVLSAGHGSMFLYSWLHLAGFDLPMDELKNFRQLHSKTPGHPEYGDTPGIEATTGPLGQGVGNAVGMATAAKMAAAKFNTDEHTIFDHHVIALAGDGCLQEGISAEASAFAGHNGLDNFILIFDSNDITLDAMADQTQSEDTAARYRAYGFDVDILEDGHNMEAFLAAFEKAKADDNGRPKLIILRTEAGRGIEEVKGTAKAHGEGGAKFAEDARKHLGLPEETFHVSPEVREYFAHHKKQLIENYEAWQKTYNAWKKANPELAELLEAGLSRKVPENLLDHIPEFETGQKLATRASGGKVINALAQQLPLLVSGSADLHGSTKNYIENVGDFTRNNRGGRNIRFGIREHAMGAIVNGFGYDGPFRASGATFLTFSDYMRPSVRLAALSRLPVFFIWTHDSVGVGEDGPTHQPVETVSALRCIPHLDVIRPADTEETAGAFAAALERTDGPTGLILTRQGVPALDEIPARERREGVRKGGYIAKKEAGELRCILLATGSEVQHALAAAKELGDEVRVVSLPCFERFERQDTDYIESVLPSHCVKRVAIEAGVHNTWGNYIGFQGKTITINSFGHSAPGDEVMRTFGITPENIAATVRELL